MVPQYTLLFFFAVAFTAVEYILKVFDNHIFRYYQWQEHQIRQKEIQKLQGERKKRMRKFTNYVHKGFDFSGDQNHDILVTEQTMEKLKNALVKMVKRASKQASDINV